MPSVKGISGPYRFSSSALTVKHRGMSMFSMKTNNVCKFWLEQILLSTNHGFSSHELNKIRNLIRKNESKILEAWREHCE
ncbi:MAG: DUF4160 domain-containing protein [Spirochaetia bacterium]|nr:DUF4160 domain-containing protein [Spirochaetia bacterium]